MLDYFIEGMYNVTDVSKRCAAGIPNDIKHEIK
jgi:hypothetical protein